MPFFCSNSSHGSQFVMGHDLLASPFIIWPLLTFLVPSNTTLVYETTRSKIETKLPEYNKPGKNKYGLPCSSHLHSPSQSMAVSL